MNIFKKLAKWYLIWNTFVLYVTYTGMCMDFMYKRRGRTADLVHGPMAAHERSFRNAKYGWKKWLDSFTK